MLNIGHFQKVKQVRHIVSKPNTTCHNFNTSVSPSSKPLVQLHYDYHLQIERSLLKGGTSAETPEVCDRVTSSCLSQHHIYLYSDFIYLLNQGHRHIVHIISLNKNLNLEVEKMPTRPPKWPVGPFLALQEKIISSFQNCLAGRSWP